jgi:hypothetical protein
LRWSYSTKGNGQFQPFGGKPFILLLMAVFISKPVPEVTSDIGTSGGADNVAADIDLSTTGYKYVSNADAEVAANSYTQPQCTYFSWAIFCALYGYN